LEGGLKQIRSTIAFFSKIYSHDPEYFLKSLIASFKKGLITFVVLLLSLGLFEFIHCLIQEKPVKIIDSIDLAISFLGFILMFSGKFLERFYGKN
jgi:hypothetical protein